MKPLKPLFACSPSPAQASYLSKERQRRRQVAVCRIMIAVLFLAIWELSAQMGYIDSFLFSSPSMVFACLREMTADKSIFLHTGVTLWETLVSFGVCTLLSLAFSLLLWSLPSLAQICEPFLVLLNSLPKSALAPLLIVWLGNHMGTVVTAAVSVAVFRIDPYTVHRIFPDGCRTGPFDPFSGRKWKRYSSQSPSPRLPSHSL